MRSVRVAVLAGLLLKVGVLGVWWWDVARPVYAAKEGEGAPAAAGDQSPVPAELLARSRGFRDLLEAVRQRGAELDHREQAVAAREAALRTLEKVIADEVTRLEGLHGGGSGQGGAPGGAVAPGATITKIYESMKAEEAAPILDRLDDTTAKVILGRMKEKQIAAILAAMNRERAVQLTKMLTGQSGTAPSAPAKQ